MTLVSSPGEIYLGCNTQTFFSAVTPALGTPFVTSPDLAEKFAFVGNVSWPDGGTHAVRKVHLKNGTGITNGTSRTFRVALQNVSASLGPPMHPDNTDDEYVDYTGTFSNSTWWTSGNLSADRTVAHGEKLAVVLSLAAFVGGVVLSFVGTATIGSTKGSCGEMLVNSNNGGTSYTLNSAAAPIIVLEAADGTMGTFVGTLPISGVTALGAWNNASNPNEYAAKIVAPYKLVVSGAWIGAINQAATNSDYDVVLYSGTTPIDSFSTGGRQNTANGNTRWNEGRFGATSVASRTFNAGDTFYIAVKPTSSGNITSYAYDVASAALMGALPFGTALTYATRNGGAWTDLATRRPCWGPIISRVDDGASSGGLAQVFGGTQ